MIVCIQSLEERSQFLKRRLFCDFGLAKKSFFGKIVLDNFFRRSYLRDIETRLKAFEGSTCTYSFIIVGK